MELPHAEITPSRIQSAERLIRPYIRRTPVLEVNAGDFGLSSASLTFKLELFQHAGSFKARGAFTNLLSREVPEVGVVDASGGNHGAAVAFAAMTLNKRARIFVPTVSSPEKISRIQGYGAELGCDRRALRGCARGQRDLGRANRRPACARLRPGGNAAGTGNSGIGIRATVARDRHFADCCRRRRADR